MEQIQNLDRTWRRHSSSLETYSFIYFCISIYFSFFPRCLAEFKAVHFGGTRFKMLEGF